MSAMNVSVNLTDHETPTGFVTPLWFALGKIFLNVFGMLGNSTVIIIYLRKKDFRPSECFILSLALIDFCFSLVSIIFWLLKLRFGVFMEALNSALYTFVTFYSLYLVFWMSFNRYIAVVKPLDYMQIFTARTVYSILGGGFLFGLFYGVAPVIYYNTDNEIVQRITDGFYYASKAIFLLIDIGFMCMVYTNVTYLEKTSVNKNQNPSKASGRNFSSHVFGQANLAENDDTPAKSKGQPLKEWLISLIHGKAAVNGQAFEAQIEEGSPRNLLEEKSSSSPRLGNGSPTGVKNGVAVQIEVNDCNGNRLATDEPEKLRKETANNGAAQNDLKTSARKKYHSSWKLKHQSVDQIPHNSQPCNNTRPMLYTKNKSLEASNCNRHLSASKSTLLMNNESFAMNVITPATVATPNATTPLTSSQRSRATRQRRVTLTLFFVSVMFIVVTLPYTFVELIENVPLIAGFKSSVSVNTSVKLLAYLTYCLNFVVNPIVYLFGNSFYRSELILLLKKPFCCS